MRTYYLYALMDPNLNIPKYIGITNNPDERLRHHINDKSITKKTKWINSLKDGGLLPTIKILKETQDVNQVIKWEIKAIALLKEKFKLTNTTLGGEYKGIGTPINVFDLQGNYLETYDSMIEYTEINNLKINVVSAISAVCLRKRNYTHGKIFRYLEDTVTQEDLVKLNNSFNQRDSKHFLLISPDKTIIEEFNSIQQAYDEGFGIRSAISEALSGKRNSVSGYIACYNLEEFDTKLQIYKQGKSKGVISNGISQYDLEGNILNTYNSFSEACRAVGIKNQSGIKNCCEGKYAQSAGFQWAYGNEPKIHKFKKVYNSENRYKPVYQYDLSGNFIKEYKSAKEAAKELNGSASFITSVANGSKKSAYGYIWKYIKAV